MSDVNWIEENVQWVNKLKWHLKQNATIFFLLFFSKLKGFVTKLSQFFSVVTKLALLCYFKYHGHRKVRDRSNWGVFWWNHYINGSLDLFILIVLHGFSINCSPKALLLSEGIIMGLASVLKVFTKAGLKDIIRVWNWTLVDVC